MSEAVEGYDLFDKMKVQKGTKLLRLGLCDTLLTAHSRLRSTKISSRYMQYGKQDVQIVSSVKVVLQAVVYQHHHISILREILRTLEASPSTIFVD